MKKPRTARLQPVHTEFTARVAEELRAQLGVVGKSRAAIAREVGLSQTITNDIFRGKRAATTDELEAICDAMGVDFLALLGRAADRRYESVTAPPSVRKPDVSADLERIWNEMHTARDNKSGGDSRR